MIRKYFKNRTGEECFNSAIANMLVVIGDSEMAKISYHNFRKHSLVLSKGGLEARLAPRVIKDITFGAYQGTLFTNIALPKASIIKEYGSKGEYIFGLVEKDTDEGLIRTYDPKLLLETPQILLAYRNPTEGHALVKIGKHLYIDNGHVKNYRNNSYLKLYFALNSIGILKLSPAKAENKS